eukprot:307866-Prymnesium_polylepis.1
MFRTKAQGSSAFTWSPRVGVYQALREINDKTDGVADDLLPVTKLRVAFRDSKCDPAEAVIDHTLGLTRTAFNGAGVHAIVGAGCSDASLQASPLAASGRVPIISPTSTSTTLSEGQAHPYFLRSIPADSVTADVLVKTLAELWRYTSIALVYSTDTYGRSGGNAVAEAAFASQLTIATEQRFAKESNDFSVQQLALKRAAARVIVLFCHSSDGSRFVRSSYEADVGGAGYLWLGSDSLADSSLWESDAALASNISLRQYVLKGFFSVVADGKPQGSRAYQGYLARRKQLPSTFGNGSSCNLETDDEGTYLWAQDHDYNA